MLPEIVGWQKSTIITFLFNRFIDSKGCRRQFQVEQEVWEVMVPAPLLCPRRGALPDLPPRLRDLGRNMRQLEGGHSDQDQDSAAWVWREGTPSYLKQFFPAPSVLQLTCNCSMLSKKIWPQTYSIQQFFRDCSFDPKRAVPFLRPFLAMQLIMEKPQVNAFETESKSFPHKHSTASVGSSPMGTAKGNVWNLQEQSFWFPLAQGVITMKLCLYYICYMVK